MQLILRFESFFYIVIFSVFLSCEEPQELEEGCADPLALNYNVLANEECSSGCLYSRVVFFGHKNDSLTFPITIKVGLDNTKTLMSDVGVIPQICLDETETISGLVSFGLDSSDETQWIAISDDNSLLFSGTIKPNPIQSCIQINVAN